MSGLQLKKKILEPCKSLVRNREMFNLVMRSITSIYPPLQRYTDCIEDGGGCINDSNVTMNVIFFHKHTISLSISHIFQILLRLEAQLVHIFVPESMYTWNRTCVCTSDLSEVCYTVQILSHFLSYIQTVSFTRAQLVIVYLEI